MTSSKNEQLVLHPLEIFATEHTPIKPNRSQQDKLIRDGALKRSDNLPLTIVEIENVMKHFDEFRSKIEEYVGQVSVPFYSNYEDYRDIVLDNMTPIADEFLGHNGISDTGEAGFEQYYRQFPCPRDFERAWSAYSAELPLTTDVLLKAHDRVGYLLYGKQWEYWEQLKYLAKKARHYRSQVDAKIDIRPISTPPPISPTGVETTKGEVLTFIDHGTALIASSEHPGHCDDAVYIGAHIFAIADGVGSGGRQSGEAARYMVRQASEITNSKAPSDEAGAVQVLSTTLIHTARKIEELQKDAKSVGIRDGDYRNINTVGIVGVISHEYGIAYANFAVVGNCRLYIIGADGATKMRSKDRTVPADLNRKFPDNKLDERRHDLAHVVTTTAREPDKADYYRVRLDKGDVLIGISDGVTGYLEEISLENYLYRKVASDLGSPTSSEFSPQDWAEALAKGAVPKDSTYHDDISVIIAKVG